MLCWIAAQLKSKIKEYLSKRKRKEKGKFDITKAILISKTHYAPKDALNKLKTTLSAALRTVLGSHHTNIKPPLRIRNSNNRASMIPPYNQPF